MFHLNTTTTMKKFGIYTINAFNLATDESYDCGATCVTYYSVDTAVSKAIDLAKELSEDNDTYMVSVLAGEYEDENGNVFGEPYEIYTFSNKDKETTIKERTASGYVSEEVDGYVSNGEFEFRDKKFVL